MTNLNRAANRNWLAAPTPGVTYAVLHSAGEAATLITRFAAGTRGGRHHHPGGEELLILQGECEVNGIRLSAGDYLYTPPGDDHELVALTDTTVFVQLPKLPVYEPR